MNRKIRTLLAQIEEHIATHGRAVISVMGEPGGTHGYPYAYSIGHADKGRPELMLTSLGGETATYLVNAVAKALEEREWKTDPDERIALERVSIRMLPADGFEAEAGGARSRAEEKGIEDLRFLQILWPDAGGRFPDEEDYDHETFPQPIWQHEQEKARSGIN